MLRSPLRSTLFPYTTLFRSDSKGAQSHDWELAYNEFTDGHDGLVIDSVKTLAFHHNRIDNFNDDGIYLTLPPRASVDRKSTRLNSSHVEISYAVFCLKKKSS